MTKAPPQLPSALARLNPVVVDDLVRLGKRGDGGYVIPRVAVSDAQALLSFGLSTDWSFEEDLAKLRPGLRIHAYDHSVGRHAFIKLIVSALLKLLARQGSWREVRERMATYASYKHFFRGAFVHFQERVFNRLDRPNDTTVERILARLEGLGRLIVKMDIEGAEYRVIDDLLAHHERISVMAIEFHDTEPFREVFLVKIDHLCRHYDIVHLHGNNTSGMAPDGLPDVVEITLLHKSLCAHGPRRNRLPLEGLDFPNDPAKADYELSFA